MNRFIAYVNRIPLQRRRDLASIAIAAFIIAVLATGLLWLLPIVTA